MLFYVALADMVLTHNKSCGSVKMTQDRRNMSLSPWDKFYYWMTGSFPKKTAKRVHDEFEKLQKSAKKAFAEEDSSLAKKSEPKPKAKAAAPKAPVKKTSATKATPVTKAKPKSAGKSSTSSSSNKKSSK
jgi:hypothetical protein